MVYHLGSDQENQEMFSSCKSGQRLCGECKAIAGEKITEMLKDLAHKREEARSMIDDYVVMP
ncbi:MAG: tryptophan--tRNA ligase, partial [Candidatus Thermoplasmatota archaeon]|nr:tryptophan--tRNA ligase [Candidatus Thermoplasmatota archaeon]